MVMFPRHLPFTSSSRQPTLLRAEHRHAITAFLERDVPLNLFALSWLENFGVAPRRSNLFHYRGFINRAGDIEALALTITERLILLDATDPERARDLARFYASQKYTFQHIVSAERLVDPFWDEYVASSRDRSGEDTVSARLISPQQMYVLTRERWQQLGLTLPAVGLRPARIEELDAVFLASAMMHREETKEDPLRTNPDTFRSHVRHRIESGRSYVWFDDHRRLVFKVDISAQSRYGVQLSGVYTVPSERGKGVATRAMARICQILLDRGWPRVTLYVNTTNAPAKKVYERVGFTYHDEYKTVFVRH